MGKQMFLPHGSFWPGLALGLALGISGGIVIIIAYLYQLEINLLTRSSLPVEFPTNLTRLKLAIPILIVLFAAENRRGEENTKLGFAELHKRLRTYGAPEKIQLTSRTIKQYLQPNGFVETETIRRYSQPKVIVEAEKKAQKWQGRETNFVWLTDTGRNASLALQPIFFPNVIVYLQRKRKKTSQK